MTIRFTCLHGHRLESEADSDGRKAVVCPLCGSVTRPKGQGAQLGSLGLTVVPASIVDSPSSGSISSRTETGTYCSSADLDTTDFSSSEGVDEGGEQTEPTASSFPEPGKKQRKGKNNYTPPTVPGFEIMQEIGRGGMGLVYHAYDEKQGRDLALKTLQRMSPSDLVRFKQEFRALADIAHPNLASLYELVSDGSTWCFTMELIKGVEFTDYVWSEFDAFDVARETYLPVAPVDDTPRMTRRRINRLYDSLRQLALGLHELHRAGKLHSDIKPSNVMVTSDGRLRLLDFGLIAEISKDEAGRVPNVIQGTPHYMSPEQAACRRLSAASDWYAVGVILYELLTGRLPFVDDPTRVMLRKQYETPVEPSKRRADVPRDLNDLCVRLLSTNPQNRPGAVEVLRAVDAVDEAERLLSEIPVRGSVVVNLVGRETHLVELEDAFSEVAVGQTRSVFVHGFSGMGKSTLIRHFLDHSLDDDKAIVLEGRCYEQESVPFKALDTLVDELAARLSEMPRSEVTALVPDDSLPLAALFPVLRQVPGVDVPGKPSIASADQQELRQRGLDGLRALFIQLSTRLPVVLFIDDLQWGDEDSATLLVDLLRPPDAPRMLLLGAYRREDVDSSDCLLALWDAYNRGKHLPHRAELAVDALHHSDAFELALQLLEEKPHSSQVADRIATESRGSPFFVWELAQHIQEEANGSHSSLDLDEVIWTRVRRLPEATRSLLEIFAAAGRPMGASEAYMAADEVRQGPNLLAQLRTGNFVRSYEQDRDTIVEVYHDRIRESVVNHLAAARLRGHHLKIATVIEQSSSFRPSDIDAHLNRTDEFSEPVTDLVLDKSQWQRVFDLAYFFDAANRPERALPYAIAAAEQAASQNAFDVAEQFFEIAKSGCEGATQATRFRVAEGLGDVLMVRGRYDRADLQFQFARSVPAEQQVLARIDTKRGYLCFKKGDMGDSARHFERALSELGHPPPATALTQIAATLKEVIVQALHTVLPRRLSGRRELTHRHAARDLHLASVYDGLGYSYWFICGPGKVMWTHLRHMNLAEGYQRTPTLGRAYALHAIIATAIPMASRGIEYADRAYAIHGEMGDKLGQGKARSFQTFSHLTLGQFEEGTESGREAVRLLQQAGDVWEANMARLILSQPLYYLGRLKESHIECKQAFEIGLETGDYSAMAIALYFWVSMRPDALPEGALQTERERTREDPLSTAAASQGRGLELLLREDNPLEAASVLHESLQIAKQKGIRNPAIYCGVSWLATALRMVAERDPNPSTRSSAIRRARKGGQSSTARDQELPRTCRARALRERAIIDAVEGRPSARKYFDASLQVAEHQKAAYEIAQTLKARGEAGLEFGWDNAEQERLEGQQQMDAIESFRVDVDD